ncbi:hypothetical protein WJX77_006302 [Trebouxia sp. C0004]
MMEHICRELIQRIDLSPENAVEVPPSGLCSIAKPGDHIARKLADELYWHHGMMGELGDTPGLFFVIDNFPHDDDEPNIQSRSLEDFLAGADRAVVVPWTATDKAGNDVTGAGRELALRTAKASADSKQQMPFSLVGHNCEAFAVMCWTGRWEQCLSTMPQRSPTGPARNSKGSEWLSRAPVPHTADVLRKSGTELQAHMPPERDVYCMSSS